MKKSILTIAALSFLIISCSSPEKKAKKLIEGHLSKNMNDFKSYEPVEFSKLDSSFSTYERRTMDLDIDTVVTDDLNSAYEKEDKFNAQEDINEKNFKPVFIGWRMNHQFRGKNAFGAMVLSDYNFQFDKDLTKIIESTDRIAATEEMEREFEESQREVDRLLDRNY